MCGRPKLGNGSGELANPQETPEDRSRPEKDDQTGGKQLNSAKSGEGIVMFIRSAIPEFFNRVMCVSACHHFFISRRRRRSCPNPDNYMVGIVYYANGKREQYELGVIMNNF